MDSEIFTRFDLLKGKLPCRIVLRLFPVVGAENIYEINLSIGFSFDGLKTFFVSTDRADNWTPILQVEEFRVDLVATSISEELWLASCDDVAEYRYVEVTDSGIFRPLTVDRIDRIQLICAAEADGPFGVKISNAATHVVSAASQAGTSIELPGFNEGVLENYSYFGALMYKSI